MKLSRIIVLSILMVVLAGSLASASYLTGWAGSNIQDTVFSVPFSWSVYGFDALSDGGYAAFVDNKIVKISANGEVSSNPLKEFDPYTFGSFVKVHDNSIYVGESSTGSIWKMGLDGSNATQLGTLAGNYDLAFNKTGQAFVSANPDWLHQTIYAFNNDGTSKELITGFSGYSGPLAVDSVGNLLYGSSLADGGDMVKKFSSSNLQSALTGSALDASSGVKVADAGSVSGMQIDSAGNIYFSSGKTIYKIVNGVAKPFATSSYYVTSLAYSAQTGLLYASANGVKVNGHNVGVISAIQTTPEPGSLLGLTSMLAMTGLGVIRRRIRG